MIVHFIILEIINCVRTLFFNVTYIIQIWIILKVKIIVVFIVRLSKTDGLSSGTLPIILLVNATHLVLSFFGSSLFSGYTGSNWSYWFTLGLHSLTVLLVHALTLVILLKLTFIFIGLIALLAPFIVKLIPLTFMLFM